MEKGEGRYALHALTITLRRKSPLWGSAFPPPSVAVEDPEDGNLHNVLDDEAHNAEDPNPERDQVGDEPPPPPPDSNPKPRMKAC